MTVISKFSQYKPPVSPVTIPEWGGETLYVRGMDATAMEKFFDIPAADDDKYSALRSARIITLHLCDEDGEYTVSDDEREETAKELAGHQFSVVSALLTECMNVSGLSQDSIEETAEK